jgi:hypothetical protein
MKILSITLLVLSPAILYGLALLFVAVYLGRCPRCHRRGLRRVGGYLWHGLTAGGQRSGGLVSFHLCRCCSARLRQEGRNWSDPSEEEWKRHVIERRRYAANDPLFELFVGDEKMARLYEPKREEMFWCSYRVEPVSEEADRVLRDESIWDDVKFRVKAKDGRIQRTFTGRGDFVAFCKRETDRMCFRSLWPIDA